MYVVRLSRGREASERPMRDVQRRLHRGERLTLCLTASRNEMAVSKV